MTEVQTADAADQLEPLPPRTVLVVDDEPLNRDLVVAILAPEGYRVLEAGDGLQCLSVLENELVDVVLMDVMMPGIDGIETCKRIRQAQNKNARIPLVFVSALHDRASRIRGKAAGGDDFLLKPVDEVELLVRVKNLIEARAYHELREHQHELLARELDKSRGQLLRVDRLATLGTLAAGVGHELKNIAAVFHGLLPFIEDRAKNGQPPEPDDLAELRRICAHLTQHGNQLLELGSPGRESRELLDLREVVSGTLKMLRVAGRTKGIDVTAHLPATVVRIDANRTRLEQVLVNLIGNAADALEDVKGRPRRISVQVTEHRSAQRVSCRVQDSGSGIPEDKLRTIFEPYYTTKPPGRGTGLGLSVVKQIVESLSGRIGVRSKVGEGSTFAFDLPLAP